MSDLLTRMIARAQRPSASVMPVMRSRFEKSPLVPGFDEIVATRQAEQAASESRADATPSQSPKPEVRRQKLEWRREQQVDGAQPASAGQKSAPALAARAEVPTGTAPASALESNAPVETVARETLTAPHVMLTPVQAQLARKEPEPKPADKRNPQLRESQPAEAKSEPPVEVHVTIGRIEVRQAAPPAPAKARTLAPPLVRLEDYLKKREAR